MPDRRLSDDQAKRLWERAAHLQAESNWGQKRLPERRIDGSEDSTKEGYATDVVRQAAVDAGIDGEFVDRAMAEIRYQEDEGKIDRRALKLFRYTPRWLSVSKALDASPEQAYRSVQRVIPNAPYRFVLVGSTGRSILEGGRLIFEVPNQVTFGHVGNPVVYAIRHTAGIQEIEIAIHAIEGQSERCEVEISASLVSSRRINYLVTIAVAGAVGSALAGGLLFLPIVSIAAASVSSVGGLGTWFSVRAGAKSLYGYAIRKAEKACVRLLNAIDVDLKTGGAFAPERERDALPPAATEALE